MKNNIVICSGELCILTEELKYDSVECVDGKRHKYLLLYKEGIYFHSIALSHNKLKYKFTSNAGLKYYEVISV